MRTATDGTTGAGRPRRAGATRRVVAVPAAVAVLAAAWSAWPRSDAGPAAVPAAVRPTVTLQAPSPAPPSPSSSTGAPVSGAPCDRVARPFAPTRIAVPGVARGARVVTPPRDRNGIPGVPSLGSAGKDVFAWDREQGISPGHRAGNVLLNAHTWPDGSALGNRLLAGLRRGDRIVVHGADARLCYRVTERVEVLASEGLPRYYAKNGPAQLAIVVCSGRRLGPGAWEKRTVWFARPAG